MGMENAKDDGVREVKLNQKEISETSLSKGERCEWNFVLHYLTAPKVIRRTELCPEAPCPDAVMGQMFPSIKLFQ